eukprot:2923433-Prymnesium_polylepis.1
MEGILFTPVRSPKFNAIEVLFGYVKTLLASHPLPPGGEYTAEALAATIEDAFQEVTPSMVAAWIACRGFLFTSPEVPL